jgi:hypothetical protein
MAYATTFNGPPRESVRSLRCPNVSALQRDTVVELHKALVCISRMRSSTENLQTRIDRSFHSIRESNRLLARLRDEGF